jgi:hypothetical protein
MNKLKRIQRSRSKGWKMPANAIYVGRPAEEHKQSPISNP